MNIVSKFMDKSQCSYMSAICMHDALLLLAFYAVIKIDIVNLTLLVLLKIMLKSYQFNTNIGQEHRRY